MCSITEFKRKVFVFKVLSPYSKKCANEFMDRRQWQEEPHVNYVSVN